MSRTIQLHTANQSLITNAASSSYALTASYAANAVGAGGLSGGTTNYIPLWSSTTSLSSSNIYQSAGNIGIGTTSPSEKLHVVGTLYMEGSSHLIGTGRKIYGNFDPTNYYIGDTGGTGILDINWYGATRIMDSTGEVLRVSGGKVGIGTTAPYSQLHLTETVTMGLAGNARPAFKVTNWGYSTSYRALLIGSPSTTYGHQNTGSVTIAFNYDPSINANGAFNGDGREIIFRNGTQFVTPNTANTSFNLYNLVLVDGNVGIGTATPSYKLHVNGNVNANGIILGDDSTYGAPYKVIGFNSVNDGGNRILAASTTADGMYFAAATGQGFTFRANGGTTAHLFINSSGNIGIGTTSPTYKLDVIGNMLVQGTQGFNASSETATLYIGNSDSYIQAMYDGGLDFYQNNTFRMRIQSSTGNVGIGTTSPQNLFHIYGLNPFARISNSGAGDSGIKISYGNSDTHGLHLTYNPTYALSYIDNTYPTASGQVYGDMYFRQNINGTMTSRMMIQAQTGNVGIGTSSPAVPLHVDATSGGIVRVARSSAGAGTFQMEADGTDGTLAATNTIRLRAGGSERITVLSNGNVGISNTNPSDHKLVVYSSAVQDGIRIDATTYPEIVLSRGNTYKAYIAVVGSAGGYGTGTLTDSLILRNVGAIHLAPNDGVIALTTTTSGNVGIGTTAPSMSLHVASGGALLGSTATGVYVSPTNDNTINSGYNTDDDTRDIWLNYRGYLDGFTRFRDVRIGNGKGSAITFFQGSTGRVGIGTESPTFPLSVNGAIQNITAGSDTAGGAGVYLGNGTAGSNLRHTANRHFAIDTYSSSNVWTERFRIERDGNIGIGTTSPAAKLHVSGGRTYLASSDGYELAFTRTGAYFYFYNDGGGSTGKLSLTDTVGAGYEIITFTQDTRRVGIGTTSPSELLHVAGNIINTTNLNSTGDKGILVGNGHRLGFDQSGTRSWNVKATGGNLQFASGDGNGYYTFTNGVGIATTSPYVALDVRGGVLRNSTRVASNQLYPVGHYTPGETVFEIDPTWSETELRRYFNSDSVSWVADSTAPGGYAISIVSNINVGGAYSSGFPYIPVDQDDTFYMECWIKNVSGTNGHYMGSIDYNESFTSLGGNPGSYGYWVMSNTNPGSSWTKVTGYIGGFGSSTGQFVAGTKYWTPQALFNYTGGGTCYISGWKAVKVTTRGDRYFMSGSIGIGTKSPATKVEISDIAPVLRVSGQAGSKPQLQLSSVGVVNWALRANFNNASDFTIYQDSTERVRIDSSGNVGINSASPTYKLQVHVADSTTLQNGLNVSNAANTDYTVRIKQGETWVGPTTTTAVIFQTNNTTEAMRITGTGNVGINDTSPGTKLVISNQGTINTTTPGTTLYNLHFTGLSTNDYAQGITFNGGSSGAQAGLYVQGSGGYGTKMYFATTNDYGAGSKTRMMVDHNGNVGIGTTSPSYLLDVNGSVRIVTALGVGTAPSSTAGEIRATNEITAYYSSDKLLKENITPLNNALNKLLRINGVEFDWTDEHINKRGGEDGYFVRKHDVGVIAQEIQEVLPEVVAEREDGYLAVRYEKMVPLLIEAIKELQAEVAELKTQR